MLLLWILNCCHYFIVIVDKIHMAGYIWHVCFIFCHFRFQILFFCRFCNILFRRKYERWVLRYQLSVFIPSNHFYHSCVHIASRFQQFSCIFFRQHKQIWPRASETWQRRTCPSQHNLPSCRAWQSDNLQDQCSNLDTSPSYTLLTPAAETWGSCHASWSLKHCDHNQNSTLSHWVLLTGEK